ncbi:MAG TPA: carboxymuconolactone decarboxylase family protein [Candidatus Limnocylindria bacterium]
MKIVDSPRPDRAPAIGLEAMTPEQRAVAERITASRGKLPGPFSALLHVPPLADRVQALGAYLRYEGLLDRDNGELAILVVARHWGSSYVWDAHAPIARQHGVSEAELEVLTGAGAAELPERRRVVQTFSQQLVSSGHVSDKAFEEATALLGSDGVIELTVVVGYYSLISMACNALGWD